MGFDHALYVLEGNPPCNFVIQFEATALPYVCLGLSTTSLFWLQGARLMLYNHTPPSPPQRRTTSLGQPPDRRLSTENCPRSRYVYPQIITTKGHSEVAPSATAEHKAFR